MTHPGVSPGESPEYPSPTITASRRLMGPNLLHGGVGAVLDVALDDGEPLRCGRLLRRWHSRATALAGALVWPSVVTAQRVYRGGASLFVSAPIDQLMTATEVAEQAWVFAESSVDDATAVLHDDPVLARLRSLATDEARPALRALAHEAAQRGVNCTFDDEVAAVGSGAGVQVWPLDAIPSPAAINWSRVADVPIVLVTGSNGKTTVVRMVAAMARACGHTVGYTCTDGVWIGGAHVERGDYSGPAGARRVLHDTSVTFAVLETARGGILRRGLAVQRANVAAVVTLSADHFGDYGIDDLESLADVKLVAARAVEHGGTLIYNAEVPALATAAARRTVTSVPVRLTDWNDVAEYARIPATLGGAARHNMQNAAIASAIAAALGLSPEATAALQRFGADPRDNMGRLMMRAVGGVRMVVDYAHNPQAVRALIAATRTLDARRRAIVLGTGGDRDDATLQEIARAACESGTIDLFVAKEMPRFLRGRQTGALSGVLRDELLRAGVAPEAIVTASDDLDALRTVLRWTRPGDLLLLGVHDHRDTVLALLDQLEHDGWRAGDPVPDA